jgi:hypothetical protein
MAMKNKTREHALSHVYDASKNDSSQLASVAEGVAQSVIALRGHCAVIGCIVARASRNLSLRT